LNILKMGFLERGSSGEMKTFHLGIYRVLSWTVQLFEEYKD
jgi:hypothetical protein